MASIKPALPMALLLCGLVLIGSLQSTEAQGGGKICPQFCYDGIEYMTCPSTGSQRLKPVCNCCLADENGCAIYLNNGQVVNCP
ncbi:proteinase inhibitor PSI-1.2 [Oryza brachyantha]|uniref:proteinase inhibitor PSI-1.2 n=1 Tax=Oryza brachyantha TaxID=4533 RepID=UPI0003EA8786|nr:proteinase inhibitor PSI-1.2 [Oryza brachyantha]